MCDYATAQKFQRVLDQQRERLAKQFASSEEGDQQSLTSQNNNNLDMIE